jgi:hypothetical protein
VWNQNESLFSSDLFYVNQKGKNLTKERYRKTDTICLKVHCLVVDLDVKTSMRHLFAKVTPFQELKSMVKTLRERTLN